ncbi:HAMP domain-containing histidine kinase [Acinetobacter sp. S40]|uniref:sensor histidine kinase n=1 Tax=unclassified Acinetobacter TaxID=196816 RepID=UPI00190E07B9|nr:MULTISPECIES: HAMP domain-containing sensor histidine kinase [unclassified Acinetobacter]MBJ9985540.1 HAMP domain-containing histidine kinase [Acinetobacter sp. S40]MBK0064513.1 HAMP domain-containing histidine kinase [Acinetobacter sp. S55]MBK0067940.1 HAMP domain-containing histidine kinase [Acinetobacter sp. S54]
MSLQLLELDQADQLSACRLSLLLGLKSEHNLIQQFLEFGKNLIGSQKAILCFHEETYFWHHADHKIHAVLKLQKRNNAQFFKDKVFIDQNHPHYMDFSAYMSEGGVDHHRIIALNILKNNESVGVALFFDDEQQAFDPLKISMLAEHGMNFSRYLELKYNHEILNELYEQQCALNFSKTKFFSIISHDLRAPFHGLLGFSEVLAKERETLDESSVQNIADYLYDTSQSTYNLLESLLEWAMAEGGRFVYHPITFNLKQATSIVIKVLNTLAIKKKIALIEEIPEDLKVYADINMITSVIQNLVSNALKFTHVDGTGKVYIQALHGETGVEVYVRDTGLGMTEQQMENIFQPRITVSFKGTEGEKGAGLGLTLCKRFVDLNRGHISVNSKEGEGTTFKVILPHAPEINELMVEQKTTNETKMV